MKNLAKAVLVVLILATIVAGVLSWIGVFDVPVAGTPSPSPRSAEATTQPSASLTASPPTTSLFPPLYGSVASELKALHFVYDPAASTWRQGGRIVTIGPDKRVVQAQFDKLICNAPPPYDERPIKLLMTMSILGPRIRPDATSAHPDEISASVPDFPTVTLTCYWG